MENNQNRPKGLAISRLYFETFGLPMLRKEFPQCLGFLSAGLTGSGSECYGYDDGISTDHDFEPGFCLFLPDEEIIGRRTAFELERAYAKLPREFMGLKRDLLLPVGGARKGVLRTAEFFTDKIGSPDGILTYGQWLSIPEHALSEAVNGELFFDQYGEVTRIRSRLKAYPEDIRKKKLAGHLLMMAQSGEYNYKRCLAHGETGAAQLAVIEFAEHAAAVIFLLNGVYRPFYKWQFRALRDLGQLSLEAELLEFLISTGNDEETAKEKQKVTALIAGDVIRELRFQGLSGLTEADLEKHAYAVNQTIRENELREMHILAGV